ncbi:hypothetical protein ACF07S_11325 [Streptomyces sp. NPDC016640]|uniref:hypothetical protein n=1 Tax=Streptomyces sp. NPDC016640 TaxID=3364969 RepID=UPI0036FAE948
MLEVLDYEKGLALAETLTEAGERLAAGEKVSGPAADRYRAAAAEFSDRYAGIRLGRREPHRRSRQLGVPGSGPLDLRRIRRPGHPRAGGRHVRRGAVNTAS